MRIGLANLPLLLGLNILSAQDFFLLVALKILGQGIIGGTFFSYVFLFSLAGTISSAVLMYIARKIAGEKYLGFAGLGCLGAMTSNAVQLVLARYFIFGPALRYLIPPFLASGFVTGIVLGLFAEYFCRRSRWYARHTEGSASFGGGAETELKVAVFKAAGRKTAVLVRQPTGLSNKPQPQKKNYLDFLNADELFIAGLLMALIFLFSRSLPCRAAQFFFFCLLALFSGKKINPLITIMIMAGIVFFHLLVPYGKVLFMAGPLRITEGSLLSGLEKAITLEGLLMLSRFCIRSDLRLPGTIGSLLGESLRLLELMRERKGIISKGHIIAGIDQLMLEMEETSVNIETNVTNETYVSQQGQKRSVKNIILLCAMIKVTAALGKLVVFSC
jgi:heptaprenyl diphosphate synthase